MFYNIQNYFAFKPEIWCLLNMNIYHLWWFISYDDDYYHSIYNLNHARKTPINIHKEAPLMVVILIVRHCEEKSMAVLVVILMCDGFDQKSVTLTLLMVILLYVAPLTKIVWLFWQMCDQLANLTKRAVTICGHSRCGRFGVEPFWLGPHIY